MLLENALHDILNAERTLRAAAEARLRGLTQVLEAVAYRLDGAFLDAARKADPAAPGYWSVEQWRACFDQILAPVQHTWPTAPMAPTPVAPPPAPMTPLVAPQPITTEPASPVSVTAPTPPTSPNAPPPLPRIPVRYERLFAADAQRRRRTGQVLWLMAVQGRSLRLELLESVKTLEGLNSRSGSLGRMFDDLGERDLLHTFNVTVQLGTQQTTLAVAQLTPLGRELCTALGWPPIESEWERLKRLHQAETQQQHAVAVLAFAYQARARGWQVRVLPPATENTAPDVGIEKDDEHLNVEVELGQDKPDKWRNQAAVQGFVALCAATPDARAAHTNDCRLARLPGRATDLATLALTSKDPGPLWLDTW